MITIDLQDDDANRTKKANCLEGKNRRQRQRSLERAEAKPVDQIPSQGNSGLIARILRVFRDKER
jgi:hypothetical protein